MFDGKILFLPIQLNDVTEMHGVHTVGLNDVKITLKLTNELDQNDNVPTLMSVLQTQMTADANLAVCILQTSRKDRYDAVKMFCCIEHPVPSQLILSRTLMKKVMQVSVVTKLALQLNCK